MKSKNSTLDMRARQRLDIVEVEPGAFSVIREGRSFSVVFDGTDFVIEGVRVAVPPDPRDWRDGGGEVAAGGPQRLTAPMPGRVVSILVAVGDTVEAGAGVVVVEAMKMQNELKASRAGTVRSIHAKEGSTVGAGEVLATIE
jgi:biotin carboxyl carrier protein